ncbi:MAG: PAS domain S-box protein [Hyphomicrobium sp.]
MTPDIAIELARTLVMCLILGLFLFFGHRHEFHHQRGWRLIVGGFGLLVFGNLLDVTDNFESLNSLVLIGDTQIEAVLENVFGYFFGFALLLVGLRLWLPRVGVLSERARRLKQTNERLEAEAATRAAGIEEASRVLRESEERFRGVVENSPSAIFLKDTKGKFRLVNKRFEEWYGVTAAEVIGKTSHEIFPKDYADAYAAQDREVLKSRQAVEREQDIVFRDGTAHSILVTKFPVMDAAGTPLGLGTINTDLTEHKRALTALRVSEAALAEAQQLAQIGHWRWSIVDSELVSCSEEFARLHGVGMEEIHGHMKHKMERVVHPQDRDRLTAAFKLFDEEKRDYEIEYRIIHPGGEARHVLEIGKAVADDSGVVVEQIGTVQDITERKLAEAAILAAMEEAELASRAKSEFLANMSHELRTPLNWIIGFAEMMKNEMLGPIEPPKYREYVDDIHTAGQHLLDLISDILDLSRIESGSIQLYEEEFDIIDLVSSCMKLMAERANSASVKLLLDIPGDQQPRLRADRRMMKQILINLLSNGVKFTPHGGCVTVSCWLSSGSGYVLQVSDTGIGIAPTDIPKALGRFQQVDGRLNRKHEGSGLGLTLTKSIVELHGGSLDLQSKLGEGTTVTVRFPAERTVAPADGNHLRLAQANQAD